MTTPTDSALAQAFRDVEAACVPESAEATRVCRLVRERAREIDASRGGADEWPACPQCKAGVLYECPACSATNYPPQPTASSDGRSGADEWFAEQLASMGAAIPLKPQPAATAKCRWPDCGHDTNGVVSGCCLESAQASQGGACVDCESGTCEQPAASSNVIRVDQLAKELGVKPSRVIAEAMKVCVMATLTQNLDAETAERIRGAVNIQPTAPSDGRSGADGYEAIEWALATATAAEPEDAPFGMSPDDARIWHAASASAYRHALEMIPKPQPTAPSDGRSIADERIRKALDWLHPYLDSHALAAPTWAIRIASFLTGGDGCVVNPQSAAADELPAGALGAAISAFDKAGGGNLNYAPAWMKAAILAALNAQPAAAGELPGAKLYSRKEVHEHFGFPELPPLPAHKGYLHIHGTTCVKQVWGWTENQVKEYAKAYASAAVAELQQKLDRITDLADRWAHRWMAANNARLDAETAVAECRRDAERLDFIERNRVSLSPEYEGPWDAQVYGDDEAASVIGSGTTPRAAIDATIDSLAKAGGAQP